MSSYTTPCFSSQCGMCSSCCSFKDIPSNIPEGLSRAKDLLKIMNNKVLESSWNDHSKKMKKIIQKYNYNYNCSEDKVNHFPIPEKIDYGKHTFKLLDTPHGAICDDPLCQLQYILSNDGDHALYYTGLPVYTREIDDNVQICAVCLGL